MLVLIICSVGTLFHGAMSMSGEQLQGIPMDVSVSDENTVRLLVKQEIEATWFKIMTDLQQQLASQGRRITYLENRDRRIRGVVDRLALKVNDLERQLNRIEHMRDDQNVEPTMRNSSKLQKLLSNGIRENDESDITESAKSYVSNTEIGSRITETNKASSYIFHRRQAETVTARIAFTAYLDQSIEHMGVGHTLKMNQVLLNDGNAYNKYTGTFTAPVTGVYMFTFHFSSYVETTTQIRLVIDSSEEVDSAVQTHDGYDVVGGNVAILHVTEGQSVWLEEAMYNEGQVYSGDSRRYCTFTGILMYQ